MIRAKSFAIALVLAASACSEQECYSVRYDEADERCTAFVSRCPPTLTDGPCVLGSGWAPSPGDLLPDPPRDAP